jgi:hypothetical protein
MTEKVIITPGAEAQAKFEALFDHQPKIDVRTPQQIADERKAR